ncbi:MAG: DNA-directed RNA polymerase subunit beta' [Victivallales bacterium]|nr:DNA-directed RNA polymerase subunit beta' [Victivallales bacterium]
MEELFNKKTTSMPSGLNPKADAESFNVLKNSDNVSIGVASPEVIRSWSKGEVKSPETINYRTFKPEPFGLFCERIFGPKKDYQCACGKYKKSKDKGKICEKCGVEVTTSRVRRERMGHIELAVPVSHIWFYKCMPSRIALMLCLAQKDLDGVLYYENYVVTDPGDTTLEYKQILTPEEYQENRRNYGDSFKAGMGAEAIETLLGEIDLNRERQELEEHLRTTKSQQQRKQIVKRIRLVEGFLNNHMDPRWMILRVLPVISPDLRPLVDLPGGRFATSDLNDLYRRVIYRNSRLRGLLTTYTPEVIIRNEKRMLQEAVDALLDNGRHGRPVTGASNRPLKSLTDMLKGKQGRFRQNLLGKRVDYSGRSVIVVGPELKLHQCGLPRDMALTLFHPFIVHQLILRGKAQYYSTAQKLIEERDPVVWDVLPEVVSGHPIMLNRAPTLHRLSIQAFDPVLIEGQAIRLHPLVCTAFNADFDGDQMAVHVPLSHEAQLEAKLIMLSSNNIFSPASGKPLTVPSQDMVLGVYYLCYEDKRRQAAFQKAGAKQRYFQDYSEVLRALELRKMANENSHTSRTQKEDGIDIHDFIKFRNPYYRSPEEQARIDSLPPGPEKDRYAELDRKMVWGRGTRNQKYIETTAGRCIFHEIWPSVMGFWNQPAGKKDVGKMIKDCFECCGHEELIKLLDRLKNLGYEWSTLAGFSISTADMLIPTKKQELIDATNAEIARIRVQAERGTITENERKNESISKWQNVRKELTAELRKTISDNLGRPEINPVWAMLDSGARGSDDQVTQLSGMRGLMSDPNGNIIETPIIHNFREGLTGLEYFNSTHGSRKGMADTALKTADAGYMTRRLVDVAHDVICSEKDCGTANGLFVEEIREGNDVKLKLQDRIIGRFSVDDINDTEGNRIVSSGEEITPEIAKKIIEAGYKRVHIRSVLTCASKRGVCMKCYGRLLANGQLPMEGDALGIIAAQSIGEPGTQLTLRTFHSGGTASGSGVDREIRMQWDNNYAGLQVKLEKLAEDGKAQGWSDAQIKAKSQELLDRENVAYLDFDGIETLDGKDEEGHPVKMVVSHNANIHAMAVAFNEDGAQHVTSNELALIQIPHGAHLLVENHQTLPAGTVIASQDTNNDSIIAEANGVLEYADLVEGQTISTEVNAQTGKPEIRVKQFSDAVSPALLIVDRRTRTPLKRYSVFADAQILYPEGAKIAKGTVIAKTPRASTNKTSDITMGLPRVSELFDARRPREAAVLAPKTGEILSIKQSRSKTVVTFVDTEAKREIKSSGKSKENDGTWPVTIPAGKHVIWREGDVVNAGQRLTDGSEVLQDYLEICGPQKLQSMLVDQVQSVYLAQGVDISDKHIEIIVRQMMRKIRIKDPGNTHFLTGEMVDKLEFDAVNDKVMNTPGGGDPASGEEMIQGVTKASLSTDSFISAASFQDTPRILTEAATLGRVDYLHGFKENVIMGHLIPAGTGFAKVQHPLLYTRDTNGKLVVISSKESNNAFAPGGSDSVYQDDFLNPDATSYSESDAEAMIENDGGSADADLFDTTIPAPDAGFRHRSGADILDDVE